MTITVSPTTEQVANSWAASHSLVRPNCTLFPSQNAVDNRTYVANAELAENPAITYLKAELDGQIAAVVMGYESEPDVYRVRVLRIAQTDLWIDLGEALVSAMIAQAQLEGCTSIWATVVPERLPIWVDLDFDVGEYIAASETYKVSRLVPTT
jgi:hypothetical protein